MRARVELGLGLALRPGQTPHGQGQLGLARGTGVIRHLAVVRVVAPGHRRGPVDGERVEVGDAELAAQRLVVGLVLGDVGLEDRICEGRRVRWIGCWWIACCG